jgi:hypothetical protein
VSEVAHLLISVLAGAYSFDYRLLPNPEATMRYLHHHGLAIGANVHDANGIAAFETTYADVCAALGVDPASNQTIPFEVCSNREYAMALEDVTIANITKTGFDFTWIDFQQGGRVGGCAGKKQNPTAWLNKLRSTDPKRQGSNARGMVLGRFGGLGAHRYQVGFSGDVAQVTWANLAYQPYFTMTASNVLVSNLMGNCCHQSFCETKH